MASSQALDVVAGGKFQAALAKHRAVALVVVRVGNGAHHEVEIPIVVEVAKMRAKAVAANWARVGRALHGERALCFTAADAARRRVDSRRDSHVDEGDRPGLGAVVTPEQIVVEIVGSAAQGRSASRVG